MTREIPLTQGAVALVDDDDYDRATQHTWALLRTGRGDYPYAARKARASEPNPGATIYLHRFLMDAPQGTQVDHINGDTLDCRRSTNLRLCTHAENARNSRQQRNSTQPYKGIHRNPAGNWYAYIGGRTPHRLGTYNNPEDAARRYDQVARETYGPFARLNFPDDHTGPRTPPLLPRQGKKGRSGNKPFTIPNPTTHHLLSGRTEQS